mgnify:CR=1 FL=1
MEKKYESGAVKPSLEVATDIAHYLNVSLDTLFGTLEKNTIPTQGLTEEQLRIVTQLVELFCRQNASRFPAFTAQQYELIAKSVYIRCISFQKFRMGVCWLQGTSLTSAGYELWLNFILNNLT